MGEYYVEELNHSYDTVKGTYEKGKTYLIALSKLESVYEEDEYMLIGDVKIEINDEGMLVESSMYQTEIKLEYNTDIELGNHVNEIIKGSQEVKAYGIPYTKSEDIHDIIKASQYILHVKVNEISIESKSNRDTYICTVIDSFSDVKEESVQIIFFKDTVKLGEEYLVLLNKQNQDSLLYTLSSKNSVYEWDQRDVVLKNLQ